MSNIIETAQQYMYIAGNIRAIMLMETEKVPHNTAAQLFRDNGIPLTNDQYTGIAEALPLLQGKPVPHKQVAALIAGQKELAEAFTLAPQAT